MKKLGINRFGSSYVPLDESLSRVVLDFSGRPGLQYNVSYPRSRVGEFDVDLLQEFFHGFVNHAKATVHIDNLRGANSHHIAETIFKAFGKALKVAVALDPRNLNKIPSTKESFNVKISVIDYGMGNIHSVAKALYISLWQRA